MAGPVSAGPRCGSRSRRSASSRRSRSGCRRRIRNSSSSPCGKRRRRRDRRASGISSRPARGWLVKPVTVLPGGRFEARNQTLENLVRLAYGFERLNPHDTVKTPAFSSWIAADEFDVTATMDGEWTTPPAGETVPTELRGLLRTLLEDRFDLKARVETRPVSVYALRLANQAGSPGPGLRPAANDCLSAHSRSPRPASPPGSRARSASTGTRSRPGP